MHRISRSTAVAVLAAGALAASALPASAGGLLPIGNPSFGNGCAAQGGNSASGSTQKTSGAASANRAALPLESLLNHCGGTDLGAATSVLRPACSTTNSLTTGPDSGQGSFGMISFVPKLKNIFKCVPVPTGDQGQTALGGLLTGVSESG